MGTALNARCFRSGQQQQQYKAQGSRRTTITRASQINESLHGRKHIEITKRSLALGAAAVLGVPSFMLASAPPPAQAVHRTMQQDVRLKPLQQFWGVLVAELQQQLSDDFSPTLVFYGAAEVLPAGTPGDPAAEYSRDKRASCGTLTSGFSQPYSICPSEAAGEPSSELARDCCRHFAYCVPRSRYAFAALDRQSSVVASPRLALAHPDTWKGVLVHEMGHCIDFYVFPGRYMLPLERPPRSTTAAELLTTIDAIEADVELRADMMANALLKPVLGGKKLCYNVATRVQTLVPDAIACDAESALQADGSNSSGSGFMTHFPHSPVSVALI